MKTAIPYLSIIMAVSALLLTANMAPGQTPSGQWDFDNGNLSATIGQDLTYYDGPGAFTQLATHFGTTTSFGIPDINGTPAKVMQFPAATNGMGYGMTAPINPNGGGSQVNEWTLIMDVLYPGASDKQIRPIIDTDQVGGPNIIIDVSDGIGYPPSGPFVGTISPDTWYRLGIVVANAGVGVYVNGSKVGSLAGYGLDAALSLTPGLPTQILGSTDTNAAAGYINSLQLWGIALDPGQMLGLGGPSATGIPTNIPPVPSFILSRSPDVGASGVSPVPNINIVLNQGSTIINSSTIGLLFDGETFPANVNSAPPSFTITGSVTNLLDPLSVHSLTVFWQDSVVGWNTNSWSFTVSKYQNVTLPAPFYLETFDELAEDPTGPGPVPTGWTVSSLTSPQTPGFDLGDRTSDSYTNWVLVSTARFLGWGGGDRLDLPVIVLNGEVLTNLSTGNLMWAESDQRCGDSCNGQYQEMYTADIDCTGRTNVFVAWKSIYEQNQDNMNCCEYSIDQGATWLPVRYMFCTQGNGENSDIYYTNDASGNPVIDVGKTFNTPDPNANFSFVAPNSHTNYGVYIKAPISTNLIPYIVGYTNDDTLNGKEIVVVRIPQADGQPTVRFRFLDDGTSSWFWGIDDLGLYEINTPVINTQPVSQTVDAGTPVTFSVGAASPSPLIYQWTLNGHNINGATNSAYTIDSASPTNAGQYQVLVSNSSGKVKSGTATLTVITLQILAQPASTVVDPGNAVSFSVFSRGAQPQTLMWYAKGNLVQTSSLTNYSLSAAQVSDSGNYWVVITNIYGSLTSSVANLIVYSGPVTNSLVAHLTFDGNFSDTSGRGNNAEYAFNGVAGDLSPTFAAGFLGQAFVFTTLKDGTKMDYATFGYPDDLKFGQTNAFSISFWVSYTNQNDDLPFISNKDWNSSGNRGWGIFAQSDGYFRANVTGTNGGADKFDVHPNTVLMRSNGWHNIVLSFVRAPGSLAGYVNTYADGALVNRTIATTEGTIDTVGLPFTNVQGTNGTALPNNQPTWAVNIGQDGTGVYHDQGSAYNIGALIDDLGIWRRALTANEAAAIYSAGQAGQDLSQAVVPAVVPPTISQSPISQVVSPGANVNFTVTAGGGTPPLTYSWQKNQQTIGGATTSTLALTGVTTNDDGAYLAIISNSGGSVTSKVAQLTVFAGSVTQDLVAHLKFDGDYKDSSGLGTDGTAVGTPTFEAGKIGQAAHLNSAGSPADNPSPNNYVTLGNPAQLKFGTNDFSISFWAKVLSQNDDKPFISNKDWNSGSNPGWAVATEGDGMKWNFRDDQSARRDSSDVAPQLEDGQWHNVLVSFQRNSVGRIYVDGQLMDTSNLSPDIGKVIGSADTTLAVNVGQDGTGLYTDHGSGAAVEMVVDDLGIWQRVVTPQEATAIYVAGQSGKDLSQAVVGIVDNHPAISLSKQGNSWVIIYTGTLYSSLTVNGAYTPVAGASSPYTIPTGSAAIQFYRSHQ